MYEIFLSYAHADLNRALDAYHRLRELGNTVWMDEAQPDKDREAGSFVGVPAGESHRSVIKGAIELSATFLICDSRSWRASDYCQEELTMARAVGTRLAVLSEPGLPPHLHEDEALIGTDLDHLATALKENAAVALAHVRLRQEDEGPKRSPWIEKLLGQPERLADARLLLTSLPAADVPVISQEIRTRADWVIHEAATRRGRRRRVGSGLLVVLLILTLVALVAGVNAARDSKNARATQARAQSLDLAAQSLRIDGADAHELALQAWELDQNSDSRSAVAVATAAKQRIRIGSTGPLTVIKQLVNLPNGTWVASSDLELLGFELLGTESRRTALPLPVGHSSLIPAGNQVYVLSSLPDADGDRTLQIFTPEQEVVEESELKRINSIGGGPDDEVWVGLRSGEIGTFDAATDTINIYAMASVEPTAITATTSTVTVLSSAGTVESFDRNDLHLALQWRQDLTTLSIPVPDVSPAAPDQPPGGSVSATLNLEHPRAPELDRLIWCGGRLHVILGQAERPDVFEPRHVSLDSAGQPTSPFGAMDFATSFACQPDGALLGTGFGLLTNGLVPSQAGQAATYSLVSSRDRATAMATDDQGQHLTLVSGEGETRSVGQLAPLSREVGGSLLALPVPGGTLVQDVMGDLWFIKGSESAVHVGALPERLTSAKTRSGTAIAMMGSSLCEVDASGVLGMWPQSEPVKRLSLSSDGSTALILTESEIRLQPLADVQAISVPLSALLSGETVLSFTLDEQQLFVGTSGGRVLRLNADGSVAAAWEGGTAALIAPRPGERTGVVAISRDGVVRLLDDNLHQLAARVAGALGAYIDTAEATGLVAVATQSSRILLLEAETLELRQVEPVDDQMPLDLKLSVDGQALIVFTPYLRYIHRSSGLQPFVNMDELATGAIRSGEYPDLQEGEWDRPAVLETRPLCTTCTS